MKRVLIVILFISLIFLTGCRAGVVDYEKKLNEVDREKYVLEELKKRHNKDFSIKLLEENKVEINCDEDGLCDYVDGAFVYTYECSDNNGNIFEVNYTDAYILDDSGEYISVSLVSYYDDVIKFREEEVKLTNDYESIIKKYTTVYKRIYKDGYDHFNYYGENVNDSFGYVYFILCTNGKSAKDLYNEVNLHRRHLAQSTGASMTVEFYFIRDWGLYNLINVSRDMRDPGTSDETTLEKLTELNEQVIGRDDSFNLRMYEGNTYNIKEKHYYKDSFKQVAFYIKDGDFQVRGLKTGAEEVKAVIVEDYNYDDDDEFVGELEANE